MSMSHVSTASTSGIFQTACLLWWLCSPKSERAAHGDVFPPDLPKNANSLERNRLRNMTPMADAIAPPLVVLTEPQVYCGYADSVAAPPLAATPS